MAMTGRRTADRLELSMLNPYEQALQLPNQAVWQRRLTLGTLVASLAFCALVFHAGWREIAALKKCAVHGISCHTIASKTTHAP